MDHTNLFPRSFTGSGLTKHKKTRCFDFHHFLKVTSSQNTFKWAPNGGPKGPLPWDPLGSQGSLTMGSLGLPRVPLPWDPLGSQGSPPMGSLGLPRAPLPWDLLGSQGSPPMGSLWLPRVPSPGIPWAPKGPLPWCKQPKNLVVWTTRLAGDVAIFLGQS